MVFDYFTLLSTFEIHWELATACLATNLERGLERYNALLITPCVSRLACELGMYATYRSGGNFQASVASFQ